MVNMIGVQIWRCQRSGEEPQCHSEPSEESGAAVGKRPPDSSPASGRFGMTFQIAYSLRMVEVGAKIRHTSGTESRHEQQSGLRESDPIPSLAVDEKCNSWWVARGFC